MQVHCLPAGPIKKAILYSSGSALIRPEVTRVEKWRNYISLRGGTVDFGKLTMHNTDLMMIDRLAGCLV
jgi:hypothetical protein